MHANMKQRVVYLDHHSSTPVDPRVVQAMMPYLTENPANPSNPYHPLGRRAAEAVEDAREQVAALIGARRNEVIFTSGATESNNIAIFGLAVASSHRRRKIITCAIEHKSVLEPCRRLHEQGFEVVIVSVDGKGHVDLNALERALDDSTLLVSIQLANNEIGTIQRTPQISEIVHHWGAIMHCDGAQAVGKIPVHVDAMGIDMLSFSAHKLHGPKGIGALFVRGGLKAALKPLIWGGGQEGGIRAGTLNVPAIVGFGVACQICQQQMGEESDHLRFLRDTLETLLMQRIPSLQRNGDLSQRLPNNSSLTFADVEADALLLNLPDVALSTGSACTSGTIEPSHVLQAIGLSRETAYRTVRIGLGRFNTMDDITYAANRITAAAQTLGAVR